MTDLGGHQTFTPGDTTRGWSLASTVAEFETGLANLLLLVDAKMGPFALLLVSVLILALGTWQIFLGIDRRSSFVKYETMRVNHRHAIIKQKKAMTVRSRRSGSVSRQLQFE